MIYSISGTVEKIDTFKVILRTGNICYEIVSPGALKLKPGDETTLFTYLSMKNEQITLYGFIREEERELFLKITKSQGIGEKMALRILSALNPEEIIRCVETEDINTLSNIKGIGRKKAERLIFELRGKLPSISEKIQEDKAQGVDILEKALLALGLKEEEARSYVKKYISKHGKITSIEDAIREIVKEK